MGGATNNQNNSGFVSTCAKAPSDAQVVAGTQRYFLTILAKNR